MRTMELLEGLHLVRANVKSFTDYPGEKPFFPPFGKKNTLFLR